VASAQPVKQTKKIVLCPAAVTTATGVMAGTSGSKGAVVAKKTMVPVWQHCVPAIGIITQVSSTESQESSPHGQVARDSMAEIASRPMERSRSPRASMPDTTPRVEPEASLQITVPRVLVELRLRIVVPPFLQVGR
jgi:hypothetical protein